ncbi:hypothetical protein ZWY2020_000566 [Hordeum vulgare]|nr:hypothetical protein ZWY2020_000566 [Hordeum vulgare]
MSSALLLHVGLASPPSWTTTTCSPWCSDYHNVWQKGCCRFIDDNEGFMLGQYGVLHLSVCGNSFIEFLSVLSTGDDMIGVEHLEEDSDGKALLKARRSTGLMSAFSGAGGMVYMEYNKGKGAKKKDLAKRHTLFKKRYT